MKKVLYGRYSKGPGKTVTTTPPALAVNTYPTEAKSFELQGRSLVLNQLVNKANAQASSTSQTVTCTNNGDGSFTINGTATGGDAYLYMYTSSISLLSSHKYIAVGGFFKMTFSTSGTTSYSDSSIVFTGKESLTQIWYKVENGTSVNVTIWPMLIDLTQTFGVDFEPTTVDQLKSVIDLDKYIPYNPGTFIHNNSTYEVNKWNQLMQPNGYLSRTSTGITYVNNNDGTVTMSGTATGTDNITYINISTYWIAGHKYLVGTSSKYSNKLSGNNISQNFTGATLFTYSSSPIYVGINVVNGTSYSDTWSVNFVDLTDIFGAGKEPSTVDECKLRFLSIGIDITKYQPYSPLGGQYCGYRNIWDEEWELGDFNSTTGVKESGSRIINTDYIPVLSNTNYYVNNTNVITVYYYDSNKTFLGYNNPSSGCFESLPNSAYINFRCSTTYGTTYKNDISIYQVSNKVDLGFNILDVQTFVKGRTDSGVIGYADGTSAFSIVPTGVSFTTNAGWRGVVSGEIPVSASTAYNISFSGTQGSTCYVYIDCYKSDGTFLDKLSVGTISSSATTFNQTFTTLANTGLVRLSFQLSSANSACFTNMCINLSQPDTTKSPHNGDYRPYLMLRGIGSDFNVWDEEWENGKIDSSGQPISGSNQIRSKNFISVYPNTAYYYYNGKTGISNWMIPSFYDINKNFVSRMSNGVYSPVSTSSAGWNNPFTVPPDCYYMKFFTTDSYGGSYANNICINLSQPQTTINPHNGQYVPHLFDTYDSMSGILTRRIKQVTFTGSGDGAKVGSGMTVWEDTYGTTNSYGIRVFSLNYCDSKNGGAVLSSFGESYRDRNSQLSQEGMGTNTSANTIFIAILASRLSTVSSAGFATWLQSNPLTLLYELNTYQVFTPIQYSVVDLGSLSWEYIGSNRHRALIPSDMKVIAENVMPNWKCSSKTPCPATTNLSNVQNGICLYNPGNANYLYTYASSSSAATPTGILTYQNNTPYKFGVVDMGSLSWTRVDVTGSGGYVFSTPATPLQMYKQSDNLWCSGYTTGHYNGTGSAIYNYGDKTIAQHSPSREFNIYVRDDSYTSASDFTNAVKGKILTYELSDSISQTTITQPISFVSGKLGKRYGVVDLGSLSWTYDPDEGDKFFFSNELSTMQQNTPNVLCAAYRTNNSPTSAGRLGHMEMKVFGLRAYLKNILYTNATAFKNTLHGQYLIYELADSATNPTYATAGNLIRKTNGDVGDVDFNLTYNTLLNENKFLISYNMGTSQSPDKRLINVGGILNA